MFVCALLVKKLDSDESMEPIQEVLYHWVNQIWD